MAHNVIWSATRADQARVPPVQLVEAATST
jgi:hypothetical protein